MMAPARHITAAREAVKEKPSVAALEPGFNLAPEVTYRDLREWIEQARKLGEICEVKGLTWQQDIGMVAEIALHDDTAACFVFLSVAVAC